MMRTSGVLVLTFAGCIFALFVGSSSGANCSKENFDRCAEPFEDRWLDGTPGDIFKYYNDTDFPVMCSDYYVFEYCMDSFMHNCGTGLRAIYQGVANAFSYACGKGAQVYLRNNDCFNNDWVQEKGRQCESNFNTAKDKLEGISEDVEDIQDELCAVYDERLNCIKNVLTTNCGSEIAEWQFIVDINMQAADLERLGCYPVVSDEEDPDISRWVVVGCIGGAFLILAVIGTTWRHLLVSSRRKRSVSRRREHAVASRRSSVPYEWSPHVALDQPLQLSVVPFTTPRAPPLMAPWVAPATPMRASTVRIEPLPEPAESEANYETLKPDEHIYNDTL